MTDRDDKRTGELTDVALNALFAEAREETAQPSGDLMARVLADAEEVMAQREAEEAARLAAMRPKQRHPVMEAIIATLGGWRAVAGLATAGVAGLAIGLGAPTTVTALATGSYVSDSALGIETSDGGYEIDDLMPSFYDLVTEG
ncbi:dihydroorotate dehydrogenase [Celeribacter halophilus]|uniref:dihydroorotate dehydrogenase n=1 Tax=Celeribacter halophilus TaxID=576117 RepID=UPI001C09C9BC|nr:dihydroorotate dehydrogenase [Celeribacter halophilus]MBU2891126.1 dihydroorotate dehydrogenase [Celeribacter halophilus]MDO6510987.1 dihydroorotate dehydrogenase [Celeribacter halophilus]